MSNLPREQATQRHRNACVSVPGVNLWASKTSYIPGWRAEIVVTDFVEPGEAEMAKEPPEIVVIRVEGGKCCDGFDGPVTYGEGAYGEGVYSASRGHHTGHECYDWDAK